MRVSIHCIVGQAPRLPLARENDGDAETCRRYAELLEGCCEFPATVRPARPSHRRVIQNGERKKVSTSFPIQTENQHKNRTL
jgi:hypothetical protein